MSGEFFVNVAGGRDLSTFSFFLLFFTIVTINNHILLYLYLLFVVFLYSKIMKIIRCFI
jgi:hypothetical protein